jgi:hypothetical protein
MSTEAKKHREEYVGLLKSIFEFLLASGADVRAIRAMVNQAFIEADGTNRTTHQHGDFALATAGRVLDAWHRDRRYVDGDANPKSIALLGRAPSVEALVRSERTGCDTAAFARQMRSLGLLERSGRNRFKPAARIAVIAGLNPLIQQYVARSSVTLLRTIKHNVSSAERSTRLIERFAEVPDLPTKYVAEFREFSQEQGWAMLKTLNDWLESRRVRRLVGTNKRTVRAGVHLYAYLDPAKANSSLPPVES